MRYGVNSMSATLARVAIRRPNAMLRADHERWHYQNPIDPVAVATEHATFAELLAASGAEVLWIDDEDDGLADSVFAYDPSFLVPGGAVLLRMGKELRQDEVGLHERFYAREDIPVLGRIEAPGMLEGGDMFWVDTTTIAVGLGPRTNTAGVEQLRTILRPSGIQVRTYVLPEIDDPDACLHLMSVASPLDHDLMLVHGPLLPDGFADEMEAAGYELLEAPPDEFDASFGLNLNVLAVAPRNVLAITGFDGTHELMRSADCVVTTFDADHLCVNCEGGPTCLTRPILRR